MAANDPVFGRRLKAMRKRKGVTLRWLAAETGYSNPYLSQLEHGVPVPSAEILARLADVFGRTMDELWRGVGRCEGIGEGGKS